MSANDAMLDAIEYISFFYPLGCSVGEVQKYLNAKNGTAYKYKEVYRFLNYYSTSSNRPFIKMKINDNTYFLYP
jgi:hypothetical protein